MKGTSDAVSVGSTIGVIMLARFVDLDAQFHSFLTALCPVRFSSVLNVYKFVYSHINLHT